MLFAAWGAQELDQLGSRHYVLSPTVSLTGTLAIVQLDGVGGGDGYFPSVQGDGAQDALLLHHAQAAADLGLVSFAYDDIDWEDEIRIFLEERASFSADAMTAMEANLRFAGPETMETKIFGRLTAWQNWVFQRPNAVGEKGALPSYGTGQKPVFDQRRI